jgi:hypothetical protein
MKRRLKIPLLLGDGFTGHLSLTFLRDPRIPDLLLFPLNITISSKVRHYGVFLMSDEQTDTGRFFSSFERLLARKIKRCVFAPRECTPFQIIQAEQGHFWFNINNAKRTSKAFHFPDNPRKMVCPPFTADGWALSAAVSLASASALYEFMHDAWKHFRATATAPCH